MVILFDHTRPIVHARASSGSRGHGRLRARYCNNALIKSITNEAEKTKTLCSETQTNCGKVETNPTRVAPIPRDTKRAGRAQQIKVLKEVNKLKKGRRIVLLFTSDCFNAISCIL